jgi:CHAT domain-containing protein
MANPSRLQISPGRRWEAPAPTPLLRFLFVILAIACSPGCARQRDAQAAFDHTVQVFEHGEISEATKEAEEGYQKFHGLGAEWVWKFILLKAKILSWQGMNNLLLPLLSSSPFPPSGGDLAVQRLRFEGSGYASSGDFQTAEQRFKEAELICSGADYPSCRDIPRARGMVEMRKGSYMTAQGFFDQALAEARAHDDVFLEATAQLNLSFAALWLTHFDEALDAAQAASQIAVPRHFDDVAEAALGNMGWAYYKLGDPEKAEGVLVEAEKRAGVVGDVDDQAKWLQASSYIYLDERKISDADRSSRKAVDLARKFDSKENLINSLTALAFVAEQAGKLDEARRYADEALNIGKIYQKEVFFPYPLLIEGRIDAREHNAFAAEVEFHEVERSKLTPVFLKWEAQRSLARLYEDEKRADTDTEYQTALNTFEAARCDVKRIESQLPFPTNAARIYEDYIHFLVAQGKTNEALRVADYARARSLAEGLGRTCKAKFAPDALDALEIARRAGGTILFYALGKEHSYLWAITPHEVRLFPLSANQSEIDAAVQRYRKKLEGPPEILDASNDGSTLYKMLVEPAQDLLKKEALAKIGPAKNSNIFIIPDGGLNNLNFETLVPENTVAKASSSQPKRYWIENVTIANAASLGMLPASRGRGSYLSGKLLLIGNSVAPIAGADNPYPELPNSAVQMENIEKYFPAGRRQVFARERATPAAYLNNHPENFSYIHFVAHGLASRSDPLDSTIILGRDPASNEAQDESFKLYARDIIATHPLRAELVTISACQSTGTRTYSGEGLVGLSWAFLRAGARNVVGALWDVSDTSTARLMDNFYGELKRGRPPEMALRSAKLAMLHTNEASRRPFYWAPFQLYTGR